MEKSRPHVIISAAISIDGKISSYSGNSCYSSKQDTIRLHKLRSKVDAILVGKNTVKKDDPLLSVRLTKGKNPIRIILDSRGEISETSNILKTSKHIDTIIVTSKSISFKNRKKLEKFPISIITTGKTIVNIKSLLKNLHKLKIKTILVEGGGSINWEFIKNDLFDEIIITVTPFITGGKNAITLVEGKGFSKITSSPKLKLKKVQRLKNELVLYYSKL